MTNFEVYQMDNTATPPPVLPEDAVRAAVRALYGREPDTEDERRLWEEKATQALAAALPALKDWLRAQETGRPYVYPQ